MARKTQKAGHRVRVFLVDDHPAVRRGLEFLLGREPDLEVCGQATGAHGTLKLILAQAPDLAVVDLTLKEGNGMKLIADLRAHNPGLKILVFSMHEDAEHVRRAFKTGADGYVTKEQGAERLVEAIREVMKGDKFVTKAAASVLDQIATDRQSYSIRPRPA